METLELLQIISQGEDSQNQFKQNIYNVESLSQEFNALTNTLGGRIFIGINDDGTIEGLQASDVHRINQLISNASSQHIKPAINPLTETITLEEKTILIIYVAKGINKPYQDKNGVIWVKSGSDKRKATSREEIQRLFQASGLIHADIMPAFGLTLDDIDMAYFSAFFQKRYGEALEGQSLPLEQTINNLNLGKDGLLNITGALLFASNPAFRLPMFIIKAAAFPSITLATETYLDNRDITGKLSEIFQEAMSFLLINIRHIQGEQGINSVGEPEIPKIVFEELLVNALVHRDYFIIAPIRIFIFTDRIEIISPGHLPNNLTVANIKAGNANIRNPVLASFAYQVLPYRGFGSGILRALANYPHIDFIDDRDGNQFKCIIKRVNV